jgi:hypothetical protein
MSKSFRTLLPVAPIAAAMVFALTTSPRHATAEPGDPAERNEKCATRLYTAMIGEGATAAALASANPQADFDTLVKDAKFQERFARFINSQFNNTPGANSAEDASYHLAKYVLINDKPWTDMFVGQYDVAVPAGGAANAEAVVTTNPNGLGYFRSTMWARRYAGNELNGIRIVTAYRMMQNTLGLQLTATTNAPDVDTTAAGRQAPACAGCHFQPWFALDKVAAVLGTVTRQGNNPPVFVPSTKGPQTILGDKVVSDDKTLAETLVADESFSVNACRLAYKYLYGRVENSCEGPVFDQCVDAFKKDKKITSGLAVVAKDPNFCEQ